MPVPEDVRRIVNGVAQSALFKTNIEEYELVDEKTCLDLARSNADYGVDKFSFVTSGRALSDKNIDRICTLPLKSNPSRTFNCVLPWDY